MASTARSTAAEDVPAPAGDTFARVKVNEQGRIVIPAEMRRALGIHPGDMVIVELKDGRIWLETDAQLWARIRVLGAAIAPGRSLVDELLAERRSEVEKELAEPVIETPRESGDD